MQPIDEDIGVDTILALTRETGTELLLYRLTNVWHEGDYAHAVLGVPSHAPVSAASTPGWNLKETVRRLAGKRNADGLGWAFRSMKYRLAQLRRLSRPRGRNNVSDLKATRLERLILVHERLGREYYPG